MDIFTSKDFYKDKALWSDPRYFRCNSPAAIEDLWGGNRSGIMGENPPASAPWGYCDRDYPRESIVSPYPFKTAQEHYEALLAETKKRGGPTQHTYATVPGEWTGRYMHPGRTPDNQYWYRMRHVQMPTVLSLLTPEYQTRMVQEAYHHGNTNKSQWPSQYCWPEGFMRRWHEAAVWEHNMMVTPRWCRSSRASRATSSPTSTSAASSTWTARCHGSAKTCRAGTARRSASGTRTC